LTVDLDFISEGNELLNPHLHITLIFFPNGQLIFIVILKLLHLCRLLFVSLLQLLFLLQEEQGFIFSLLELFLDGGVLAIDLLHMILLHGHRPLHIVMITLQLLQFVLARLQLILNRSQLPLGNFGISTPLLNLSAKLRFQFKLLLLYVFNIVL